MFLKFQKCVHVQVNGDDSQIQAAYKLFSSVTVTLLVPTYTFRSVWLLSM